MATGSLPARPARFGLAFIALVAAARCGTGSNAPPPASAGIATGSGGGAPVASPSAGPDAATASAPTVADGELASLPADASAPPAAQPVALSTQQQATSTQRAQADNFPPVSDPPQVVAITPAHPMPTRPDPAHGHFTLEQATAGLPPGNDLVADIETSMGTFTCTLMPNEAPVTVANFVGLARGLRDFWDPTAGRWTRRPFYDGSVFHRVIPEFMVQGGDNLRSGRGGPGHVIRDENVADHNAPGLLCMANRGPNTGGGQFFITEVALPRLNGSYSVFGRCAPVDLVLRVARVPRSPHDQPIAPVYIQHVTVHR